MSVSLTKEEYQAIEGKEFKDDAEIRAILDGVRGERASETSSALGAGAMVGDLEIPPLTAGVFPNLEAIDSSLLKADVEEHTLRDVINATYVICKGREAVREVSVLSRRTEALERERETAQKSPELYAVYLDRADMLAQTWMDFDDAAQTFWEEHGAPDMQLVMEAIVSALNHATAGFASLPDGDGPAEPEKKTSTMLSGWARLWRAARRSFRRKRQSD